jgi:hypothetical protein
MHDRLNNDLVSHSRDLGDRLRDRLDDVLVVESGTENMDWAAALKRIVESPRTATGTPNGDNVPERPHPQRAW